MQIRNFSIIAHIDHGKTTLTDTLLRYTGTILDRDKRERIMDSNQVEQERGITIKMAPVRMIYNGRLKIENEKFKENKILHPQSYILNLIDTPGHVDFSYEVSRSLASCEGAILLVDATQGVQAQTLSHYEKARELGLTIIPVLNKVDLPSADVIESTLEMMDAFGFSEEDILHVSAKTGEGIENLISAIIEKIPPAPTDIDASLKALVMTSVFDTHKGVVAYVRVVSGTLDQSKLHLISQNLSFQPLEIGIFSPQMKPVDKLTAGEVGYVATGIKDLSQVRVGDTVTHYANRNESPLPGFKLPLPMVFMEIFPIDADNYPDLLDGVQKLSLHDSSLTYTGTNSPALGNGVRMGFLGVLHAEVVLERLSNEFELELIATAPSVKYLVTKSDGIEIEVNNPSQLPDPSLIRQIKEPFTRTTIFTPEKYSGAVIQFVRERRGELLNSENVGTRVKLLFSIPLGEIIVDFHDQLKSLSSGFASMEYIVVEYKAQDIVKVSILVNHETIDALSIMTHADKADETGRRIVKKLKEVVPRQLFEVPIQAAIGGKIIARETIKAFRKDVTAKLYGGDVTRRQKLLKKQAKGKKKMKQIGKVTLNQEAFFAVLRS